MFSTPQLPNVWLASVHFEENPSLDRDTQEQLSYRVNSDITIDDLHRWEDENETHALVTLSASVDWSEDGAPFSLEVAVRGFFYWDNVHVEDELARSWLEYNATHLFWPYLRSYITTITAASSYPSLTIYTVSVPESLDFDSEENVRKTSSELQQQ